MTTPTTLDDPYRNTRFPVFTFRMRTPDEGEKLRKHALTAGGSVSEFCRQAVLEKLEKETASTNS